MEPAQALAELREVSSQITAAVALDGDGALLASSPEDAGPALAAAALVLVAAASDLGAGTEQREVTRVEVELGEGALFVVREGEHIVAATTGPDPTSGLVVYDLRTCAQGIRTGEPKRRRTRKPKEAAE
jgi:predicted regulator of Ras-like GTPase activity (Roadblock/LC7/MglB family)